MKKLMAALLCAMLLMACVSVQADEIVPAYEVIVTVPDGYTTEGVQWTDPFIASMVLMPEGDKPVIMMVVSYNDAFSDLTFNDELPEEEFKAEADKLAVNQETGEVIPYTVETTGLGTKVIMADHPEDGYQEYYTIWHGYEISLFCANVETEENEYTVSPITEEQKATIMQFLTDLDLTRVIEEIDEPAA